MGETTGAAKMAANPSDKLRVFISYSRAQVHFADEMELALKDKGHDVLIDRHGIAKGEEFQKRLGEMLLACDTVVFILSDESAASEVCAWEVATAKALSKRMLVVTLNKLTPGATPPPALAGIDWIHCWRNPAVPGSSQTKGFLELDNALRTDLSWLRQKTLLQEQAVRWQERGASNDSSHLLQSDLLNEALAWTQATPVGESIPEVVASFIKASEQADARRKEDAEAQIQALKEAVLAAETAIADLQSTNAALRKGRILKAALSYEFSEKPLRIGAQWLAIAVEHELATCIIQKNNLPRGSGFLISGNLLHPEWPSSPVVVTASHLAQGDKRIPDAGEFEFRLSLSDNPDHPHKAGRTLYLSNEKLSVFVFSTPKGFSSEVRPIQSVASNEFAASLPIISRNPSEQPTGLLTDHVVLAYAANQGRTPELLMMRIAGIEAVDHEAARPRLIWMPRATEPGSSGAALVDSQTGALIGVQMVGKPGLGAGCAWIGDIIEDIRQNASTPMLE
jgi:hypothetical protein